MKFSPEFIPHELFHRGIWLLPEESHSWYYYYDHASLHKIVNKKFNGSVDEPLKELVSFLHERNIRSTPSCSGHDHSSEKFHEVYDKLLFDEYHIRNGGLVLKDIETDKKYLYADPFYRLPWTKSGFLNGAMNYQHRGVIGLQIAKFPQLVEKILQIQLPGVEITFRDDVLFIFMEPLAKFSNEERWQIITDRIKEIVLLQKI